MVRNNDRMARQPFIIVLAKVSRALFAAAQKPPTLSHPQDTAVCFRNTIARKNNVVFTVSYLKY